MWEFEAGDTKVSLIIRSSFWSLKRLQRFTPILHIVFFLVIFFTLIYHWTLQKFKGLLGDLLNSFPKPGVHVELTQHISPDASYWLSNFTAELCTAKQGLFSLTRERIKSGGSCTVAELWYTKRLESWLQKRTRQPGAKFYLLNETAAPLFKCTEPMLYFTCVHMPLSLHWTITGFGTKSPFWLRELSS